MRFRKSVKLAPGLRLNFSGSGTSWTVGPRGASVNFGKRGTYLNTGIPGTGLYDRSRLGAVPSPSHKEPGKVIITASVSVEDDGTLTFKDTDGKSLPDFWVNRAKRQKSDEIRALIHRAADKINVDREDLRRIHTYTPKPTAEGAQYQKREFEESPPTKSQPRIVSLLNALFGQRKKIEAENERQLQDYNARYAEWEMRRAAFDAVEDEAQKQFAARLKTDVSFMEEVLTESLSGIAWPRETALSTEVTDSGRSVSIDVDMPEIEDFKVKIAVAPDKGFKMSLKALKEKDLNELYSNHVHSVGFRIVGEVFALLPTVDTVTLSAFTQRIDKATGNVVDAYVYSVRVTRLDWLKVNFERLEGVKPEDTFAKFELWRKVAKNGTLEAITPL